MSLWRSTPGGHRTVGWRRLGLVAAVWALVPAVLGVALLGVVHLMGTAALGEGFLRWGAVATLAILSPLLSVPFFGLLAVMGWMLLRRAAFGWLPALALGGLAGGVIAATTGQDLMTATGALLALLYRQTIAVLVPEAV